MTKQEMLMFEILVKTNNDLNARLSAIEAEYEFGRNLIEAALKKKIKRKKKVDKPTDNK